MRGVSTRVTVALLGALASMAVAQASEVLEHRVSSEDGRYYIYLEMRIDAGAGAVYDVLTDYGNIKQLNDSIKVSEVLQRQGDKARVLVISEGCVLFFCRRIRQVQDVTPLPRGMILSRTDPEVSDLKHGRVLWHIRAADGATRITYSGDFAPDFWVPPVFGSAILRQRLLEEATKTIRGIERVVQHEQ